MKTRTSMMMLTILILLLPAIVSGVSGCAPAAKSTKAVLRKTAPEAGSGRGGTPKVWAAQAIPFSASGLSRIGNPDLCLGWVTGYTKDRFVLLHTTDNGAHWEEISPLPVQPSSWSELSNYMQGLVVADFLRSGAGFLAWKDPQKDRVWVLTTKNNGRTWSASSFKSPARVAYVTQLDFINQNRGWLVVNSIGGSGKSIKWLYATKDGGEAWRLLDGGTKLNKFTMGSGSEIEFTGPDNGWWSLNNPVQPGVWLYHSTDGGSAWNRVTVPLPHEVAKATTIMVSKPVFSGLEGTLFAEFFQFINGQTTVEPVIFHTADGGTTWNGALLKAFNGPYYGNGSLQAPFFLTAMKGWVIFKNNLYHTADGGKTWTKEALSLPLNINNDDSRFEQLKFDTSGQGQLLAGVPLKKGVAGVPKYLLSTANGGRTWTVALK